MPNGKPNGTVKVALSGVLGIVSAVIVCMVFYADMNAEVKTNTQARITIQRRLERIENKIDRLSELVMRQK